MRHLFLTTVVALSVAGCNGVPLTNGKLDSSTGIDMNLQADTGVQADGGICSGDPRGGAEAPTTHRPTAVACSASARSPAPPDGGTPACTTTADCASDAGSLFTTCLHGRCSFDQCLTDADCGTSDVCACASDYYGGNVAYHPNVCVPGNCRVDGDCGPGGYCSASHGYCGSFQGFYCHSKADTCVDETKDCTGCGNACVYTPTVGAFTCATNICAG
jgi:hypothetical protein